MKNQKKLVVALLTGLLAALLSTQPAQGGSAIDYEACLNTYGYTPTAIALCSTSRPSIKQAKPIEYRHCLKMYTNISVARLKCAAYRPENRLAKPIEYAHCLKWWGRSNPDCLKYKP